MCVRAPAADESFSQSRLAVLVFTMPLQLQRPFNLKPSQFEFSLNIWPIFLLQLNDWMRPHRFLLTSGPIWNLVPLSSAQNERIHTHACEYTTHTCAQEPAPKREITKGFVCAV